MATRETLLELIEPAVEALGYELVDIDYRTGGNGLLRLYIDKADGISLDDCERVSHEISTLMDVEDPIPEHYTLEVSSPGVNRVLRKPNHFSDFAGNRIKVELKTLHEGRRRYVGRLLGVDGEEIIVETDEGTVRVPLSSIHRTRLAPELQAQRNR
ncbi:MAG: ribosome maturation factor RimP [Gammaproteobacteria bacterium]|nr:ribosome maturation factor RimP [Gammaproteobacteria bacterium]